MFLRDPCLIFGSKLLCCLHNIEMVQQKGKMDKHREKRERERSGGGERRERGRDR